MPKTKKAGPPPKWIKEHPVKELKEVITDNAYSFVLDKAVRDHDIESPTSLIQEYIESLSQINTEFGKIKKPWMKTTNQFIECIR